MKIKFNTDDNLPFEKKLEMHNVVMIIDSVFYDSNKYYPKAFFK